jgi:hypothetical protein
MFGRKGLRNTPVPETRPVEDGRAWVDGFLAQYEKPGSSEFAQALGHKLFDSSYHAMKDERGVQIEAIVAMLSSVGGFFCILPVMQALKDGGRAPADIGMLSVGGADGATYYFGDAPNRLLCEHPLSLLSLVFGAAHQHGAKVSIDLIHAEMSHVAAQVGSPEFMTLDLPSSIQVDAPDRWLQAFLPFVLEKISDAFIGELRRQGMPNIEQLSKVGRLPPNFILHRIVGFAIQQAIDVGHGALDPTILARIALQCAIRTSKLDPDRLP